MGDLHFKFQALSCYMDYKLYDELTYEMNFCLLKEKLYGEMYRNKQQSRKFLRRVKYGT